MRGGEKEEGSQFLGINVLGVKYTIKFIKVSQL